MSQQQKKAQERDDAWRFWQEHICYLQKNRIIFDNTLEILAALTRRENIGFGEGQIQPGVPGQWSVFYFLFDYGVSCSKRLLLSGLPAGEVAVVEKRLELEESCFNPEDPKEVREYDRVQKMSNAEVERELIQLERRLGK